MSGTHCKQQFGSLLKHYYRKPESWSSVGDCHRLWPDLSDIYSVQFVALLPMDLRPQAFPRDAHVHATTSKQAKTPIASVTETELASVLSVTGLSEPF